MLGNKDNTCSSL